MADGRITPDDEHNRSLLANVHPTDWVNPTPNGRYNLVVIGAGTAGLVTAAGAAGMGAKVALIERHLMGGDCLNVGCVPSKALLAVARRIRTARKLETYGVHVPGDISVNFAAVMERMRRLRAGIAPHDSAARFRDLGIDVFLGQASFRNGTTIAVGDAILSFSAAVIATGARAWIPEIPGLADADPMTNETLFTLTELPQRLAVLGGGPIGCEMAQAFAAFGAEVTLIEKGDEILAKEDPEAAAIVRRSLERDGVRVLLQANLQSVSNTEAGCTLHVATRDGVQRIVAERILIGAGRQPNVEGLELDAAGVAFDTRHGVHVDDRLRTANPRIYAAGDICSKYKFTHAADFMARTVIQNALFFGRAKASRLVIPWCTYTFPELAHVGRTSQQAAEQGLAVDTYTQPWSGVDRAILEGDQEGFVRVHTKRGTDQIVGATIVGEQAGDMIGELTTAMTHGLGLGKIKDVIHPYPTTAEGIRKLGDAYNRTRLKPWVKSAFQTFLKWRR